jgi:hypothetical protein
MAAPRPAARHPRPAHPAHAPEGGAARLGHLRTDPAGLRKTSSRSTRARSTRRCIASNTRDGSRPSGRCRSSAGARSTTASPRRGAEAAGRRDAGVGTHVERDRPRDAAGVGDAMTIRDLKLRLRALLSARPGRTGPARRALLPHRVRDAGSGSTEGMPPDEARARAQARFGSVAVMADECRDERGTAFVDNTLRDVQFACAVLQARAAGRLTIVATVAIGLGVVAVLFTILNTFLFRVDAVPDIGAMYAVERAAQANDRRAVHPRQFEALRRETVSSPTPMPLCPTSSLRVDGRTMAVTLVSGNASRSSASLRDGARPRARRRRAGGTPGAGAERQGAGTATSIATRTCWDGPCSSAARPSRSSA